MPLPPSDERTFRDTGVRMNPAKWSNLASRPAVDEVLGKLRYSMVYGSDPASRHLDV